MTLSRRANQIRFVVKLSFAVRAVSSAGLVSSREKAFQTDDALTVTIDARPTVEFAKL
jgi:hypothetical protein